MPQFPAPTRNLIFLDPPYRFLRERPRDLVQLAGHLPLSIWRRTARWYFGMMRAIHWSLRRSSATIIANMAEWSWSS